MPKGCLEYAYKDLQCIAVTRGKTPRTAVLPRFFKKKCACGSAGTEAAAAGVWLSYLPRIFCGGRAMS